jgi:hypothetical protein
MKSQCDWISQFINMASKRKRGDEEEEVKSDNNAMSDEGEVCEPLFPVVLHFPLHFLAYNHMDISHLQKDGDTGRLMKRFLF